MDTGKGFMVEAKDNDDLEKLKVIHPKYRGVFTVGEKLEAKGSIFLVKDISPFGIKLKVVKE
jgi:hypothetical protein